MKAYAPSRSRRTFAAAAAVSALMAAMLAPLPAAAQGAYPDKPIRIVVPYAAGGGVDIVTRLVSQKMGDALKQTIIVDNRPGAATNIGMDAVARAPADGYTLLTASNTLAANGALFSKLTFDPARDFTPVGAIGYAPLAVVVPVESSFKTLKDLTDYGRAHPDKLTYASAGNGSSGHLASELLKRESGMKALHVPYKGGSPAVTDLLGQRISFMSINPLEVVSHVKAGKLRALAVLDDEPASMLPDVPTVVSQGLPGAMATVWWGLIGPKDLPPDVTAKLNAALQSALNDPDVKKRFAEMGAVVTPGTDKQFGEFVAAETTKWTKVIQDAGIKAD
ncbi:tripartite tricarboxylate transporter substrate binding protein [Achromobacter mucicolens]|uniref:Bug family tripartite tricarboxylate transporter substrate binding protein n=1 Tax=Achromobacter mucicolens TaxID=1389922 RepID=UPI00244BF78F|nr:tripartite tricarboxylate transporter substrate binding protein [Achromobacter mucicolens]MDG9967165.1 tripartite tricarboxylate transporter substrate binding protein [Achromobacter mucicolens]